MLDIGKAFATDEAKETEGAWFPIGDGCRLRIARIGNQVYARKVRQLMAPHRATMRAGQEIPAKVQVEVTVEALATTILLDWEGVAIGGEPLPYSQENAKRLLTDYKDFRDLVAELADQMEAFRGETVAEGKETSRKSSAGG